jgi:hypothetical protein
VGPEETGGVVEPPPVGVVGVLAVASLQQTLLSPGAGSPKLALLQSTEFANDFTTELAVVPYLTSRVPSNVQVPYSCAHSVHACGVAMGVVGTDALDESTAAGLPPVPPPPPPQAARTMEAVATNRGSNIR